MRGGALREHVISVVGPGLLLCLSVIWRSRRRREGTGPWEVLHEVARSCGAAIVERAQRTTTVRVLDRIGDGGRVHVTDGSGRKCTYEVVPPPAPGPADE